MDTIKCTLAVAELEQLNNRYYAFAPTIHPPLYNDNSALVQGLEAYTDRVISCGNEPLNCFTQEHEPVSVESKYLKLRNVKLVQMRSDIASDMSRRRVTFKMTIDGSEEYIVKRAHRGTTTIDQEITKFEQEIARVIYNNAPLEQVIAPSGVTCDIDMSGCTTYCITDIAVENPTKPASFFQMKANYCKFSYGYASYFYTLDHYDYTLSEERNIVYYTAHVQNEIETKMKNREVGYAWNYYYPTERVMRVNYAARKTFEIMEVTTKLLMAEDVD